MLLGLQPRITDVEKKECSPIMVSGFTALTDFPIIALLNNKVLSGISSGATSDRESTSCGGSVAAIWENMWRDGRKYGV